MTLDPTEEFAVAGDETARAVWEAARQRACKRKGKIMSKQLDCGHADDWNGSGCQRDGKSLCKLCGDAAALADFLASSEKQFGYVSSDLQRVTSWGGGVLARITGRGSVRKLYTPSGGFYESQSIRAIDALGREWKGRGPGAGMYVRLSLVKQKGVRS